MTREIEKANKHIKQIQSCVEAAVERITSQPNKTLILALVH